MTNDPTEVMEELQDLIDTALQKCGERGMRPPFIMCVISPNGSILALRATGTEVDHLAEHFEGGAMTVPMTIVVLDQDNKAARITIEKAGRAVWH
jgi:hypothetical protein